VVNKLDQLVPAGMILLIVFSALAHGAVEPWSIAVLEVGVVFLLLTWAFIAIARKRFSLTIPPIALPVFALLLYSAVQCATWENMNGDRQSLSVDAAATRTAMTTLGFLFAIFLIAANFFKSRKRLRVLTYTLVSFGFVLALLGILQLVGGSGGYRLWIRPVQDGSGWLTGPFVNHNHFAGYLELLAPLPVALLISGVEPHIRALCGFAAAMMAMAIVLTASRGGIVSLVGGVVFLAIVGTLWKKRVNKLDEREARSHFGFRRKVKSVLAVSAILVFALSAVMIGSLWIDSDAPLQRLVSPNERHESFELSRGWIWKTTGNMIRSNWLLGVGLGAYGTAYPKYSDNSEPLIVDRAHNDYLQVLSDTGLIGGMIGLWFLLTFAYSVMRIMKCASLFEGAVAVGCASACVSLLIHSLFDFNLQIPATALLFLVLNAVLSQAVFINARLRPTMRMAVGS